MDRRVLTVAAIITTLLLTLAVANVAAAEAPQLKCETGPVPKTFGSSSWLVYSCDDGYSLVIVSAPGNPAMPFYFMFHRQGAGYGLNGEGTGRQETTAAAFEDLKRLSLQDIEALVAQTKAVPKKPPSTPK